MKKLLLFLSLPVLLSAETRISVPNLDFENQLTQWENHNGMASADTAAAHSGKYGLHIVDDKDIAGSNIYSGSFPVKTGLGYKLTFWGKKMQPDSNGTSFYVRLYTKDNKQLSSKSEIVTPMKDSTTWAQTELYFIAPKDAAFGRIWIHSANAAISDDAIDDIEIFELTPDETKKIARLSRSGFPAPSPARVQEIYEMLSDKPQGMGYPVSRRDKWDHLPNPEGAADMIANAEKMAQEPPPELKDEEYLLFNKTGDRKTYERPYFQRKHRLFTFAVAEGLENKGRFLPALEREIDAILHEKSWVLPAHDSGLTNFNQTRFYADLFASERASDLSTVDWWFQDKLKPETRTGIRREVFRRTVDPYVNSIRTGDTFGHGWMFGNGNWNAVCTGNMVNCILTIVEDRQTRAEVLAGTEYSDVRFLSGFTPDGYCSEGVGYWGYGFGHYLCMGEHILQVTNGKMNIFDNHPGIEAVAAFPINIQIQDGIAPAFADCGVNARPSDAILTLIQRHWPKSLQKQIKARNVLNTDFPLMPLIAFDDETEYRKALPEEAVYPIRSVFGDAGIYIFRHTDADGKTFGVGIKGGHNAEHHNHNDVGSFMVAWNNARLIVDPGAETYTRQTFSSARYTFNLLNSFGHPVPVVAGKLQKAGRKACAEILKTDFTDDQDTVVMDLTKAYPVPELKSLTRTLVFNRPNKTITLTDAVEYTSPQDFSTALISNNAIREHGNQANHLIYSSLESCLDIAIKAEGGEFTTKTERVIRQFEKLGPYRLGIAMAKPVEKAAITMTIKATSVPEDVAAFYKEPDLSALKPDMAAAITVQAEAFTAEKSPADGGKVVTDTKKLGVDGAVLKLWDHAGHALSWDVDVPKAGTYLLKFRAACGVIEGATRTVIVDGKPCGSGLFPCTGSWGSEGVNAFIEAYPTQDRKPMLLKLSAGKHTIELLNDKGAGLNLDWFKLIPVAAP